MFSSGENVFKKLSMQLCGKSVNEKKKKKKRKTTVTIEKIINIKKTLLCQLFDLLQKM